MEPKRRAVVSTRFEYDAAMDRSSLAALATTVAIACLGCPARAPSPAPPSAAVDDHALRIRVANAEARRAGGLAELIDLASPREASREQGARVLALRGLGRIGGATAIEALLAALSEPSPEIVAAAAGALGVAGSLDELEPAITTEITARLIAALPRAGERAPIVIEALGRVGDATAQPRLVEGLAGPPVVAEAAALALGRHGRRKIAWTDASRAALGDALASGDPRVRYAVVWALSREHEPPPARSSERLPALLAEQTRNSVAEIRAQAVVALVRRKLAATWRTAIEGALRDPDWRVAVEAGRAVVADPSLALGPAAVAALGDRLGADPRAAHVAIEQLRGWLAAKALPPDVISAVATLGARAEAANLPPLTAAWIDCLVEAVRARGSGELARVERCGRGQLPDHLRLPLLGELIAAKSGALSERRAVVARMITHNDARVAAAGLGVLNALWSEGSEADHRAAIATLASAIGAQDPILAGSAIEAAPGLYDAIGSGDRSALDAAVVARARTERDVELAAALFGLIADRAIAGGARACRDGLTGHPVRAQAASKCLAALGEPAPLPPAAAASPPPVDVAAVIGKRLAWHLRTSRGPIVVELRPDIAPWAVATIAALTRRGYYDGLAFHRVVPDFVVQGGDPTQSGAGGPGFAIPAEPATLDDTGFAAGGVGIADAGRDSGGSQWFIMHARAPHLDGRYTWFGVVTSGQPVADALQIGDRVLEARIVAEE